MTNLSLSALSADEQQGITFSMMSASSGEMGVATFLANNREGAAKMVAHTATLANVGLVPRSQGAVDVMAEVLA